MFHNGTRVKALEIRHTSATGEAGPDRQRTLPVPIASPGVRASGPISRRARSSHHRPMAAFLTQLALQYDDITEARRVRLGRRQAAANGYGTPLPTRKSPVLGTAANIEI